MLHGAFVLTKDCFNTQPPKGGWWRFGMTAGLDRAVSTHSRLKAAGSLKTKSLPSTLGFNTQPPKGGWSLIFLFKG